MRWVIVLVLLWEVHHGYSVGLFTPSSVAWQSKVTERWKDLCPLFQVNIEGVSRQKSIEKLCAAMQAFIRSVGGAAAVNEVKNPVIDESYYRENIPLMAKYSLNDIAHLASYRPLRITDYVNIFESLWNGKLVY